MAAILLCQHLHFNPKFTRNYNLDLKFSSKVKGTIRHLCTRGNFFIITINRLDIFRLYLWVKTCRHSQQWQQSRAHVPGRSEPGQWQEVLGDAYSIDTTLINGMHALLKPVTHSSEPVLCCCGLATPKCRTKQQCLHSKFAESRPHSSNKFSLKQFIFHRVPSCLFYAQRQQEAWICIFFFPIKATNWDSKMCEHLKGLGGKSNDSAMHMYVHAQS